MTATFRTNTQGVSSRHPDMMIMLFSMALGRRANHKKRIATERGYLNLELNYEDVAEFDYRPLWTISGPNQP